MKWMNMENFLLALEKVRTSENILALIRKRLVFIK